MHFDIAAWCAVITLLLLILGGLVKATDRLARMEMQLQHLQGTHTKIEAQQTEIQTLRLEVARHDERLDGHDQRIESLEGTRRNVRDLRLHAERPTT